MEKLSIKKRPLLLAQFLSILPGMLACFILAYISHLLETITPSNLPFNYVIYGILIGMLIRNLTGVPVYLGKGFRFSAKTLLFLGVILLGGTLNLMHVLRTSIWAFVLVSITITTVLYISSILGKFWNIDLQARHLIGTGISICGISAIMALSPVIKAKEKVILIAVASTLLIDVCMLFSIPFIVEQANLSQSFGGYLAGSVVGNTAQSIATGFVIGETAGTVATITKTARNMLMPFVILFFAYYYTTMKLPVGVKVSPRILWSKFPKFILVFLLFSLGTTLEIWGHNAIAAFAFMSKWLFSASFVGIGSEVNLKHIRFSDLKVVLLGVSMAVVLFTVSFALISFFINP